MARTHDSALRRIAAVRRQIRAHDRRYYEFDRPTISDTEYDRLFGELEQLEARFPDLVTPESPTQRVAGAARAGFVAVDHLAPMRSLQSVTSPEDVRRFDARAREALKGKRPAYVIEPKLDGLSIELVYERGRLVRASTRGDGNTGEDVTANVRTIRSVPDRLRCAAGACPRLVAVRGEAMMRAAAFRRLNARLKQAGEPEFANPRNAAAGSIRQLDPRVTADRALDLFCYEVLYREGGRRPSSETSVLATLKSWGLPVIPLTRRATSTDEVLGYHREMENRRARLDYEIDGVVLKIDDLEARARLGVTGRHPRWALAFKFAARAETTVVRDIVVQVGRTGALTPVALLTPVSIGGVTVSRATLHNSGEIRRLGVRIGDTVRVARAGDVIPDIVERVPAKRARGKAFRMPRRCPSCHATIVSEGAIDRCPNGLSCPAQLTRTIRHFGSRHAMNIRGLGPAAVQGLVESGLVRSVADLFSLRASDVAGLEAFGPVLARNLLRAIDGSRETELWRFVNALSIPGVGLETARALAEHFGTLKALRAATPTALRKVPGIGPATAEAVGAFLRRPATRRVIEACLRGGVRIRQRGREGRGPLSGQTIVFTGTLESMSRDEAEDRSRQLGARPAQSVTGGTSLVVAGANPGSKAERARELGVRTIGEREFLRMAARVKRPRHGGR